MNPIKKLIGIVFALTLSTGFLFAKEGSIVSKIIHAADQPLRIELSGRQFMRISNFVQTSDSAEEITATATVAVFQGAGDLPGINVLLASKAATTQVTHEELFIGGPAVVYVAPVSGSTLFISYLRGSD
jgi:hypothetical protein